MARNTDMTKRGNDIRVGDWINKPHEYGAVLVSHIDKTTDAQGQPVVLTYADGGENRRQVGLFFSPTDPVTVHRNTDLSATEIGNMYSMMLIDACAGIRYWSDIDKHVFSVDDDPTSEWLSYTVTDAERDSTTYHVDHDVLHLGIERLLAREYCTPAFRELCESNGNGGDYDSLDMDLVVQLALFNEVIYG